MRSSGSAVPWRTLLGAVLGSRVGRAGMTVVAIGCVVLGLTAATGGLRAAPSTGLPVVVVGDPANLGPVRVTVLDAVVTDQVETGLLEATDGADAWLVVRVVIEATGTETVLYPHLPLTLPAGLALSTDDPRQVLLRDGGSFSQVHPGLPEEVAYLWPVGDAAEVPPSFEVELLGRAQYLSPMERQMVWASPEPVARLTVLRGTAVPAGLVEEAP